MQIIILLLLSLLEWLPAASSAQTLHWFVEQPSLFTHCPPLLPPLCGISVPSNLVTSGNVHSPTYLEMQFLSLFMQLPTESGARLCRDIHHRALQPPFRVCPLTCQRAFSDLCLISVSSAPSLRVLQSI